MDSNIFFAFNKTNILCLYVLAYVFEGNQERLYMNGSWVSVDS